MSYNGDSTDYDERSATKTVSQKTSKTKSDPKYPSTGKPWSRAHEEALRTLRRPPVAIPYKQLESILGRTQRALRLRLTKLQNNHAPRRPQRSTTNPRQPPPPIKQEPPAPPRSRSRSRSGFKIRLNFRPLPKRKSPTLKLNFATVHPDYCRFPQLPPRRDSPKLEGLPSASAEGRAGDRRP